MIFKKNEKMAIIHIAKSECGLSDDNYRALLSSCAGIDSAKELTSERQFEKIMAAFKKLGFKKTANKKNDKITSRQKMYISGLWQTVARNPTATALAAMIERITHKTALELLTRREATNIIQALRQMEKK